MFVKLFRIFWQNFGKFTHLLSKEENLLIFEKNIELTSEFDENLLEHRK